MRESPRPVNQCQTGFVKCTVWMMGFSVYIHVTIKSKACSPLLGSSSAKGQPVSVNPKN